VDNNHRGGKGHKQKAEYDKYANTKATPAWLVTEGGEERVLSSIKKVRIGSANREEFFQDKKNQDPIGKNDQGGRRG